jgi:hypothetical protein
LGATVGRGADEVDVASLDDAVLVASDDVVFAFGDEVVLAEHAAVAAMMIVVVAAAVSAPPTLVLFGLGAAAPRPFASWDMASSPPSGRTRCVNGSPHLTPSPPASSVIAGRKDSYWTGPIDPMMAHAAVVWTV